MKKNDPYDLLALKKDHPMKSESVPSELDPQWGHSQQVLPLEMRNRYQLVFCLSIGAKLGPSY